MSDPILDGITAILSREGADNEQGWHSWRCFDKDRYPEPCTCTQDVAAEIVALVEQARADERDEMFAADVFTLWVKSKVEQARADERSADVARLHADLAEAKALLADRDEAYEQGQRDEREAADRRLAHITELLNRQKITHAELIGPQHPVLIEVSRVEAAMKEDFDD